MLGLEGQEIHQSNLGWSPVYVEDNLAVMSIGGWSHGSFFFEKNEAQSPFEGTLLCSLPRTGLIVNRCCVSRKTLH
eukprot:scaffold214338_cov19-Tisochrysis_lutea.AAC.1